MGEKRVNAHAIKHLNEKHAEKVLTNLHFSLKLLWTFLMTQALIRAIRDASDTHKGGIESLNTDDIMMVGRLLLFMLLFVRFFFGDIRLLDAHYIETIYSRGIDAAANEYSRSRVRWDTALLLVHGTLFNIVANKIGTGYADRFFVYITVLLTFNVFWLMGVSLIIAPQGERVGVRCLTSWKWRNGLAYESYIIWIINNFAYIALSVVALVAYKNNTLSEKQVHLTLMVLLLVNSLLDLILTKNYYLPDVWAHCTRVHPEQEVGKEI